MNDHLHPIFRSILNRLAEYEDCHESRESLMDKPAEETGDCPHGCHCETVRRCPIP